MWPCVHLKPIKNSNQIRQPNRAPLNERTVRPRASLGRANFAVRIVTARWVHWDTDHRYIRCWTNVFEPSWVHSQQWRELKQQWARRYVWVDQQVVSELLDGLLTSGYHKKEVPSCYDTSGWEYHVRLGLIIRFELMSWVLQVANWSIVWACASY